MPNQLQRLLQHILDEVRRELPLSESDYFNFHYYRYLGILMFLFSSIDIRPDMRILDIGISPGHLAMALKKLGNFDIIGVSYNTERNKEGWTKKKIIVKKCNIEKESLPFEDNSFDLILFFEVLEHLMFSPMFALKEMRRVLKRGGFLMLTTPNAVSLTKRLQLLLGKNIYWELFDFYARYPYERHNREFTMREVLTLLKRYDFEVVKYRYFCWWKPSGKIVGSILHFLQLLYDPFKPNLLVLATEA